MFFAGPMFSVLVQRYLGLEVLGRGVDMWSLKKKISVYLCASEKLDNILGFDKSSNSTKNTRDKYSLLCISQ